MATKTIFINGLGVLDSQITSNSNNDATHTSSVTKYKLKSPYPHTDKGM